MKRFLIIPLSLLLFISSCSSPQKKNEEQETANATSFFDKLQLKTMDGEPITTKDLEGKTAFVNVWATWCKPCLQEMPSIERAKQQLEKEGYMFLAISDEDKGRIEGFINKNDYTFTYAQLGTSPDQFNVYSLPASFIVNSEGEILYQHMGMKEWDSEESIALFKSHLKP